MNFLRKALYEVIGRTPETAKRPAIRLPQAIGEGKETVFTLDMIHHHPSHAVQLNVRDILGLRYPHEGVSDYDRQLEQEIRRYNIRELVSPRDLMSLSSTHPEDYATFLWKHLENGGTISCVYDRMIRSSVLTADHNMTIPRGCGSKALNVLVPEGITVNRVGRHDHGANYNMTDGSVTRGAWTPLYTDVAWVMKQHGWVFTAEDFEPRARKEAEKLLEYPLASRPLASTLHDKPASIASAGAQPSNS